MDNPWAQLKKLMELFMKPLLKIRDAIEGDQEAGNEIFEYLYYRRNGIEERIKESIQRNKNITLVGEPGKGKTCTMHYLFNKLSENQTIFPIILDHRRIPADLIEIYLMHFIQQMREYFSQIRRPINLPQETTTENVKDHWFKVLKHLDNIPKNQLSKKLVILLDDLDHAPDEYFTILRDYFLLYADSDRAVLVLSVRRPLLNNLRTNEFLRECYHINPQEIVLPDVDLKELFHKRLLAILRHRQDQGMIARFIQYFSEGRKDRLLRKYAQNAGIELSDKNNGSLEQLPFNDEFYALIGQITLYNLRRIEELLPEFCVYELEEKKPSFNEAFVDAYISCTATNAWALLDLVTVRTKSPAKKRHGNAILQNVLEYYYHHDCKDDDFYSTMENYGINKEQADWATTELVRVPSCLVEPEFIYSAKKNRVLVEQYKITKKGVLYVDTVLRNANYYRVKRMHNEKEISFMHTNRSYHDEWNRHEQ